MNDRRNIVLTAILAGGLIAGSLDILYAVVFSAARGVPALRVLQSVAGGLLGQGAYEGGHPTAILGLFLHFVLALLLAAIFYGASRQLHFLTRHPVTAGALYGILVYAVMNLIVLPLSAFPHPLRFVPEVVAADLLVHAFGVGVPIALAARWGSLRVGAIR